MSKKILTILRHAKTETGSANQSDESRILVQRGIEATKIMGKYMLEQGIKPEKVLCSTAIRTTETLLGIEHVYRNPMPVEYVEKLYMASAAEILNVIAEVPEEINHLLVVAHNPGVHELAMRFAKEGSEALIEKMAVKFPTCAMANFACYAPDWKIIADARSELLDFVSPKMLGQIIN